MARGSAALALLFALVLVHGGRSPALLLSTPSSFEHSCVSLPAGRESACAYLAAQTSRPSPTQHGDLCQSPGARECAATDGGGGKWITWAVGWGAQRDLLALQHPCAQPRARGPHCAAISLC